MNYLISWIANADMEALKNSSSEGPLLSVLQEKTFDTIYLLSNRSHDASQKFVQDLQKEKKSKIELRLFSFSDPTDLPAVWEASEKVVSEIRVSDSDAHITFFVTPGTNTMTAVFFLIGERLPQVDYIQHSKESGTRQFPWKTLDYLTAESEAAINDNTWSEQSPHAAFKDIEHDSWVMRTCVDKASRYSKHEIRILLLGESGTGKERFAQAIHNASGRSGKFVAVNCGAIPASLIESELFGYEKGAFTGANAKRIGKIEAADKGSLFLDEIGELPLEQQVKLLRFLQEGEIVPVGSSESRKVDVRVIAATHRDLLEMVRKGEFREDLFYRLAAGIIQLPPLRNRGIDLMTIAEKCLADANRQIFKDSLQDYKKFDTEVRKFISRHQWKGNIRELQSTILRAVLNTLGDTVTCRFFSPELLDIQPSKTDDAEVPEYVSDGSFSLEKAVEEYEKVCIKKALADANGVKQEAARLLGWKSHQNLTNRMKKYGL